MLPGFYNPVALYRPRLEWVGAVGSASDLTTYNFGSFTMPFDGLLVAIVVGRESASAARSLSSVSIDGSAATLYAAVANSNAGAIAVRRVAAGSRAVSATFSAAMSRAGVGVWALAGTRDAPFDNDNHFSSGPIVSARQVSLDSPGEGIGVYGIMVGSGGTVSWSGATERYDAITEVAFAFADKNIPAAGVNSETATHTSTGEVSMFGASW